MPSKPAGGASSVTSAAAPRATASAKAGNKDKDKDAGARALAAGIASADAEAAAAAEGPPTELPVYADADGPGDDPALAEQWNAVAGAEGGRATNVRELMPTSIPTFSGMTVGQAIRAAHENGVELAFDDTTGTATGIVLAQQPPPGPSTRGALCRVALGRRP